MKNIIVLCIHDREQNLKHWIHCWKQCTQSAQLVIIHSDHGKEYEVPGDVIYLRRPNVGYDIGKFQDICRTRLPGFPEDWDNLLWVSDDCFPMVRDFAAPFFTALEQQEVGIACMEISPFVRRHVRTTGFAIKRSVAEKLSFPVDPVTTKEDCYKFEHRSDNHLLAQVEKICYKVVQVAPKETSPLFDFGYHRRLKNREREHYQLFGQASVTLPNFSRQTATMPLPARAPIENPTISIICPIFDKYPQIISILICQTYQNWELHLIHDGPNILELPDDPRIKYEKVPRLENDYGHTIRREWLQKVQGEYVLITNPDNFYAPVFLERCLTAFNKHPHAIAVYCNQMVHSYKDWQVIPCSLLRGYIDCGGVMLRTKQAREVGWNSTDHSADWFFFNDIITRFGRKSFVPFRGCYFVHN